MVFPHRTPFSLHVALYLYTAKLHIHAKVVKCAAEGFSNRTRLHALVVI